MRMLVVFFMAFVLISCASMMQDGVVIRAYGSYEKGECSKVYQRLSEAESYKDPVPALKAEIIFLRSMCLEYEKKYDEAVGLYSYIIEKFPSSEYSYRAAARIKVITGTSPEIRELKGSEGIDWIPG